MIRTTLLGLCLLTTAADPAPAPRALAPATTPRSTQDASASAPTDGYLRRPDELGVATLDVRGLDEDQIFGLLAIAERVVGASITVDGDPPRSQPHFEWVGDQVFVIDREPERARALEVLRDVAERVRTGSAPAAAERPELRLWTPVHLPFETALSAAEQVLEGEVRPLPLSNAILLRADAAALERAWTLLHELDAPRPQLTVELLVLGSVGGPDTGPDPGPLPADLREGLAALLPHRNFDVLAGASLRTSAGRRDLRLLSAIGDAAEIGLDVDELALDTRNGLAVLRECRLALTPVNSDVYTPVDLSTTLDVPLGEYVVVSSVGRRDLYFVLRVVAN